MSDCKFVLTEFDSDSNYNMCSGVFDNPEMVLGRILSTIIDNMDDFHAKESKIRFRHDDANDDYYDIICKTQRNDIQPSEEYEQVFRVFYLREKGSEENESN